MLHYDRAKLGICQVFYYWLKEDPATSDVAGLTNYDQSIVGTSHCSRWGLLTPDILVSIGVVETDHQNVAGLVERDLSVGFHQTPGIPTGTFVGFVTPQPVQVEGDFACLEIEVADLIVNDLLTPGRRLVEAPGVAMLIRQKNLGQDGVSMTCRQSIPFDLQIAVFVVAAHLDSGRSPGEVITGTDPNVRASTPGDHFGLIHLAGQDDKVAVPLTNLVGRKHPQGIRTNSGHMIVDALAVADDSIALAPVVVKLTESTLPIGIGAGPARHRPVHHSCRSSHSHRHYRVRWEHKNADRIPVHRSTLVENLHHSQVPTEVELEVDIFPRTDRHRIRVVEIGV